MNVEVQVAVAVVPAKVQVVKVPVTPVSLIATVPVGVLVVPGDPSVTLTLQVDPWLITTGVVHETVVVVTRLLTTSDAVFEPVPAPLVALTVTVKVPDIA